MLTRVTGLVACLCLSVIAPRAWAGDPPDRLLEQRLQAHIEFLADDLLRGRQPGTDGYNIAANYVASQFQQMGLLPAGDDGLYLQQVPLRTAWLEPGSASMSVSRDDITTSMRFVDQFFMRPNPVHPSSALRAPMVFVGYGIEAPELAYNDYADIDVAGKVVVFLAGQPQSFPSEEGAHFSSSRARAMAAVRHGAVGIVKVQTPRSEARMSWDRIRRLVGMPSMNWLNTRGEPHAAYEQLEAIAYVEGHAATVLFDESPHSLQSLFELDQDGGGLPVFDLHGVVSLHQSSRYETISSPNVVAALPGSDPLLAKEYVVYTAHLDHLGELPASAVLPGQNDRINNGALDNASGIAVMLETAHLFTRGKAPRRSMLFIAVTGEEKGLVGSEYFAMNPTIPADAMVAEVNLDMPLLLYDFGDVIAFGAEHSTLGEVVAQTALAMGVTVTPDPYPEQNIFVRSDHYRFVQQGVPSVFLATGVTSRDSSEDAQAIFEAFLKNNYHQPSDDPGLPIHYGAAARFTRINHKVGETVANQSQRPRWREGDFFGRTYAR